MIEKLCKNCFASFPQYNTLQNLCSKCLYNKLSGNRKRRKPIKRIGKVTQRWMETRREWITLNPPETDGFWHCYLKIAPNCDYYLTLDTLTLDHKHSRTRKPELRNDLDNLAPACKPCNQMKGSLSAEEVKSVSKR